MTRTTRTLASALLSALVAVTAAPTSAAAPTALLPAAARDLAPRTTVESPAPSTAPLGGPVRFTWPIDQAADDLTAPAPHRAESTGFHGKLTRAALRRGVAVPVSRPGALIKLSGPARDLELVDPRGRVHRPGDGLRAAGNDRGAFTLDPALGVGAFTLRANAESDVHLDVREPDSDIVLAVQAAADVVLLGEPVRVRPLLSRAGQPLHGVRVAGRLLDPSGREHGALVRGQGGQLHAALPARVDHPAGALWTLEVTADATVDGVPVRRTVTTAVAVAVPTARYTGAARTSATDGVRVELELDVASAGRYAATAVLYGTNREGASQPIAVAQSADELAPGRRWLALEYDAATVAASGMRAPFELRDLRLADQGRMSVLHRQARGLSVTTR